MKALQKLRQLVRGTLHRVVLWLCSRGFHLWSPVRYIECGCYASVCRFCGHSIPFSPSADRLREMGKQVRESSQNPSHLARTTPEDST